MLLGTVMSKTNQPKLAEAQKLLAEIKRFKLKYHERKYANDPAWQLPRVIEKLNEEVKELSKAIDKEKPINVLDELADISNVIDIIVMMIIDGEKVNHAQENT